MKEELISLEDLFIHELRDIYDAETQLIKSLPKMVKASSSEELQTVFRDHLEITRGQAQRLEEIFDMLGVSRKGVKCKGMQGLLDEGKEALKENGIDSVVDVLLIADAQKIEHYEIAAYGCACAYAKLLQYDEIARILHESLDEEKDADKKFTEIAENAVNLDAMKNDFEMEQKSN
jgi:ferritin-like metal-binding protein YciE